MQSVARRAILAAATGALLAAMAPATASATAFCAFSFTATITPGLSVTPGVSTFTSGGNTGPAFCHGDVYGKKITGPGKYGATGQTVGPASCANGNGVADTTFVLPTADGPVSYTYHDTFSYVLGAGPFMSPTADGGFGFLPVEGNCLTAPVTKALVMGFAHLTA